MKQIVRDRNILKRLVESYGKKDVLNFVKHLNESEDLYPDFPYYDQDVIDEADLQIISIDEAKDIIKNNWVTLDGQPIKGYPKFNDFNKIIEGLDLCNKIYYGESCIATDPFHTWLLKGQNPYSDEGFGSFVTYHIKGIDFDIAKVESDNWIVLWFGNDYGDDDGQIIVAFK